MKKFFKASTPAITGLVLGAFMLMNPISCQDAAFDSGALAATEVSRAAYSSGNGTIDVTNMSGNSMTVSYTSGQKTFARLYVSEGNGKGLVCANANMSYSGGKYTYTLSHGTFTGGAKIYVCVLVNDNGAEKCVPQGNLADSSSWTQITYGAEATSSGSSSSIGNGTYRIVAKCSGKSLDADAWAKTNGGNVIQWDLGGDQANQKWILIGTDNGYYKILNQNSGLAVDVSDVSYTMGANVHQWEYVGGTNQQWKFEKQNDGYYKIIARHSGLVLDISNGSKDNGANVQQWEWNGSDAQKWQMIKVSDSTWTESPNPNTGTTAPSTGNSTAPSTDNGRRLVWSDEFNGSSLDGSNWNVETGAGGWGNNELQYYTNRNENLRVENGNLVIQARNENYNGAPWTSARIKTAGKREFTYGKVIARMKLPSGQGVWPAFWMLGSNIGSVGWPRCDEIDIMERVNTTSHVVGTAHWDNGGHVEWGSNTENNYWNNFSMDPTQWHEYAIEWNTSSIKWYVDGKQYMEMDITVNSTEEFHKPFFILFNLAMGGNWPGYPNGTTPAVNTMYVDYVRVYQ